jgi:NAD(P)-dependent dehydrogenase (short-subunit alcohol dehydrogenase family)
MTPATGDHRTRVVVVTGGAAGIGRAIAEELGRQGWYVVTLDPGVGVDGRAMDALVDDDTTAHRIVLAGGQARASETSVTDREAVDALFRSLADEFGALDAVVNVAGISRPTGFGSGTEQDWSEVIDVHVAGYLNVLRSALPLMIAVGAGRVLGVTSGSGWRQVDTGAYGCAKRAVASITWQIGRVLPDGVTVNALSPIAATRMVTSALSRARTPRAGDATPATSTRGGLDLGSMPLPEDLGPIAAYLASDRFGWASGNVVFSSGAECAIVAEPTLIEIARADDTRSLSHALSRLVPAALVTAEAAQSSQGASNPRVPRSVFREAADPPMGSVTTCLVVSDDPDWIAALTGVLGSRGVTCIIVGAGDGAGVYSTEIATGFDEVSAQVTAADRDQGPIDAVIVAFRPRDSAGTEPCEPWELVLVEHEMITEYLRADGAWYRAVADFSLVNERPVRAVILVDATSSAGRSRAQAATQLSRSAHTATGSRVDACTISVESAAAADVRVAAELAAHLVCGPDTAALSGAELMVDAGWIGLRSHPRPTATISFGGPSTPDWLDDALRRIVPRPTGGLSRPTNENGS